MCQDLAHQIIIEKTVHIEILEELNFASGKKLMVTHCLEEWLISSSVS